MVQVIQFSASPASNGTSDYAASCASASGEFALQTEAAAMQVLEAELHEHRYYLEQKVAQRTEQLSRRITLLETCNATLAGKLAEAKKDIAMLRKQLDSAPCASESDV